MICRLCGLEKKLIEAHVIPRSFHRISPEKGVIRLVTNAEGRYTQNVPKGVYDYCLHKSRLTTVRQFISLGCTRSEPTIGIGAEKFYDESRKANYEKSRDSRQRKTPNKTIITFAPRLQCRERLNLVSKRACAHGFTFCRRSATRMACHFPALNRRRQWPKSTWGWPGAGRKCAGNW